jgi:Tfp pilus assembly protein PilO
MTMMRRVALIALGGLLVVVAGWYVVFWRAESSHLQALKAQEAKAAANVSQLDAQLSALRVLQREVPAEKAALNKLDQDIPEGPSLDQLLDVVNHAASQAGVALTAISTPEPTGWGGMASAQGTTTGPGPQSMSLSISVNGSNAGLLRFITALDSAPRLLVVDNFSLNSSSQRSLSGSSQSSTGSTGLTVETYYVSSAAGDPASDFPLTKSPSSPSKTVHAVAPVRHGPPGQAKAKTLTISLSHH